MGDVARMTTKCETNRKRQMAEGLGVFLIVGP
jgi:hypothetical protein